MGKSNGSSQDVRFLQRIDKNRWRTNWIRVEYYPTYLGGAHKRLFRQAHLPPPTTLLHHTPPPPPPQHPPPSSPPKPSKQPLPPTHQTINCLSFCPFLPPPPTLEITILTWKNHWYFTKMTDFYGMPVKPVPLHTFHPILLENPWFCDERRKGWLIRGSCDESKETGRREQRTKPPPAPTNQPLWLGRSLGSVPLVFPGFASIADSARDSK